MAQFPTRRVRGNSGPDAGGRSAARGRLRSRPAAPAAPERPASESAGLCSLRFGGQRDGLIYVPAGYRAESPAPLVLMLHGAGGDAHGGIGPFLPAADEAGLILLAPDSRGMTWDLLQGGFGPDVVFIDQALTHVFGQYAVDANRCAIQGFSDGASYALSLGVSNGDLFTHVVAFSPGYIAPAARHGLPPLFISHGTADPILPVDRCSRRIVPAVQRAGYDVVYREFEGGHDMPVEIVREAVDWLLGKRSL
jgi:phospholipase/carboxylesterase